MSEHDDDVKPFHFEDNRWDRLLDDVGLVRSKKHAALNKYADDLAERVKNSNRQTTMWRDAVARFGLPGTEHTDGTFVVDERLCAAGALSNNASKIKEEVRAALGEINFPNEPQWRMILSENPSVCVNAGAGSGKSTTLLIRLYVLRRYLDIDWHELTIFTYSANSRKDLIEKALKTFGKLNEPITREIATDVIRTFHSFAALEGARSEGMSLDCVFEIKCSAPKNVCDNKEKMHKFIEAHFGDGEVYDVDNSMQQSIKDETENDDDKVQKESSRIRQNKELIDIYIRAYNQSQDFRDQIAALYLASIPIRASRFNPDGTDPNEPRAKKSVKEIDLEATRELAEYWRDTFKECDPDGEFISLYEQKLDINTAGEKYWFNGLAKESGRPIYFCVEANSGHNFNFGNEKTVQQHINSKLKILNTFYDKQCHVVRSKNDLVNLLEILKWHSNYFKGNSAAPAFDYVPAGELRADNSHISERMYSTIQFIENHALDVPDALDKINPSKLSPHDDTYIEATKIFHQILREDFNLRGIITFNDLFIRINTQKMEFARHANGGAKRKLKHLLIDEFQDICPLYAEYIKAIKLSLYEEGEAGSLMVIGDDFQSIYGWKGSSPNYFLDYCEQFPSRNPHEDIVMEDNYRSTQAIIDFAEFLLGKSNGQRGPLSKKGRSHKKILRPHKPQIYLDSAKKLNESKLIPKIKELILLEAKSIGATKKDPLYVMARKNSSLSLLRQSIGRRENIRFLTFHSSKGLESHSTILIDSCFYDSKNPIKNEIVRQHLREETYQRYFDVSQKSEALRLAYVAASRAKVHSYWILSNADDSVLTQRIRKECELCEISELNDFGEQNLLKPEEKDLETHLSGEHQG